MIEFMGDNISIHPGCQAANTHHRLEDMAKTLFEKIWDAHVVRMEGETTILYIDRHITHDLKAGMFHRMQAAGTQVRRARPVSGRPTRANALLPGRRAFASSGHPLSAY